MILSVYSDSLLSIDSYRGGVFFFINIVPRYWYCMEKHNFRNDQEVAQPKPNPVLKAEIMK